MSDPKDLAKVGYGLRVLDHYPEPEWPTDFRSWSRTSLERIARQATAENRALRSDLRAALDAYRSLLLMQATNQPTTVNDTL